MNLECPHRLLSTLYHRATPLLRCWAMQSQKPMPWKILWNFSHLHPLDPSFNLFLLRLHAAPSNQEVLRCHQNDPGIDSPSPAHGGDPSTVAVRQAPRTWGQPPFLETRPRTGDSRLVWRIEWEWSPGVMVGRTSNQSVRLLQRVMWQRFWGISVFGSRLLQVWAWTS